MTFDASETSVQDGQPIELYTFVIYGQAYRYTTASEQQLVDVFTYAPMPGLSRGPIEETGDIARNDLTIRAPETFEVAQFFDPVPPSEVMTLEIKRVHRGGVDPVPWWAGRVLNCEWKEGLAVLSCENIFTSLRRTGLRRLYQRTCPHVLYGAACRAVPATFAQTLTVSVVAGRSVTVPGLTGANGRFTGGYLEWIVSISRTERRGIKDHNAAVLELTHPIADLFVGATVNLFPGCAHDLADCQGFFSNAINYGGWPYFQAKNPMGGNSVF